MFTCSLFCVPKHQSGRFYADDIQKFVSVISIGLLMIEKVSLSASAPLLQ